MVAPKRALKQGDGNVEDRDTQGNIRGRKQGGNDP